MLPQFQESCRAAIECTKGLWWIYVWINECWCHSGDFLSLVLTVKKYVVLENTIDFTSAWAIFGLRLVDIYSEYRFQIHQASLYSIDFLQWLPWKESDYFFTQSVRTNGRQYQWDKSAFNCFFCDICIWWKESYTVCFFCASFDCLINILKDTLTELCHFYMKRIHFCCLRWDILYRLDLCFTCSIMHAV